jgi:RNA polymerase-binding transcription factor DksA
MFSEEKKNKLKQNLEGMKVSLEKEILKLETPVDMGDYPGPDDNTDESEQTYNQRSAAASLRRELNDVESALIKMEKGKYGKCENCSKDIEEAVLDISPDAHSCKECNKKNIVKK